MTFEWFVSLRYLRAKRKQKFISLISVISVLGVAVGVLALIVVLAVYTGFTDGLRDQIIGINSHVIIQQPGMAIEDPAALAGQVEQVEGVKAATPYVYAQALINYQGNSTGIILRGIDPEDAGRVMTIESKLKAGRLADLVRAGETALPGIILGSELAALLHARVGAKVKLISPNGPLSPMGVLPNLRGCRVTGIFETGMYEYDSTMGYIDLDTARSLAGLEKGVHGLEVRVDKVDHADRIAAEINRKLGPFFSVRDWMMMNQNLFAALKLEKFGLFLALDLIILVAALNIISALVMVVMEKTRDIAILKSMGATTRSIMRIFFYQGAIIGVTGTSLGVAGGLALCWVLKTYKFIELPRNVYPMSTMPIKVVAADVSVIAVSALAITLLATLYPSWKGSRVNPAEALGYE